MDNKSNEIREEEEGGLAQVGWPARLASWFRRGAFLSLTFFTLTLLLIQIPSVQNWLVDRITQTLSKQLETTVRIDKVDLNFFDEFTLQGIYIEDYYQDTLLYSRELTANFDLNPFVWMRRGLEIETLRLEGARLSLHRPEGAANDNLQQLLLRLFPADTTREKRPFRLNLKEVVLREVRFEKEDAVKGSYLYAFMPEGRLRLNRLALHEELIDVKEINLQEPRIVISNSEAHPLPKPQLTAIDGPPDSLAAADTSAMLIRVNAFTLTGGSLEMHNYRKAPVKETPDDVLDFNHLDVFDIDIDIRDFSFSDWNFKGVVNNIALRDGSGFQLEQLSVREALVSPTRVELNDLDLITPYSHLEDTLHFKYREYADFKEFPDKVLMDIRLNQAAVAVRDIITFAPKLEANAFFGDNQDEVLRMDGRISGRVNNLRGRDLNIGLADGSRLIGNFSSRNLAVRNGEFLNLRLDRLKTSMRTLRQLIPRFNPPENFNRLGQIDFSGSFDGFFVDFVAYGELRTNLGAARMDMRMNLKEGREKASYSGNITLEDFDLGAWSDNPNLGKISFNSKVINGSGLIGEQARAILIANIESFIFKGYSYENAYLEGELRWNRFIGSFNIEDENIDFAFRGDINLSEGVPRYEFSASIRKVDLQKLNLSKKDLVLSGDVILDLRNRTLADLEGEARVTNFNIRHDQDSLYTIDSIQLSSVKVDTLGNKNFSIRSDVVDVDIDGRFDVQQVPEALIRFFYRNYPLFSHHLGIQPSQNVLNPNEFSYDIHITDTKGINRIFHEQLGRLQDVRLKGRYAGLQDSLYADLALPQLEFGKFKFIDVVVLLDAVGDQGDLELAVDSTVLNEKRGFPSVALLSFLDKDTLTFGVTYDAAETPSVLEQINLDGRLFVLDSTYMQVEFDQSRLVILESLWNINADNYVRFGNKTVETKNFTLTKDEKVIKLESFNQRGLKLSLLHLDFSYIDEVWDYDPLDFGGEYNVYALVKDVFEMEDISASAVADTFYVNGDDWGNLRFDALAADLEHPVTGYLSITKDTAQLIAEGSFNIKSAPGEDVPIEQQVNYFDFQINISGYPLSFSEYFIGETVTNTIGSFNADLHLFGLPAEPNVEGNIIARNGGVTIDYLQTRYTFDVSHVEVDNHLFNATGTILTDKYGHQAKVYGGVRHNHLRDLGFMARLSTERFLAIDTKKEDNNTFYGHALGNGEIWFSGSFKQPDIYIDAEVGDSTELIIPINSEADASELSYIQFVDKSSEGKRNSDLSELELSGVSLEMDLSISPEATVKLVFDEQAGDIIKGAGRGNIRIIVPRSQENFQMSGNYVIEEGDYLFTLYNVVNKNFRVRQGGTINWTGDPFGAEIDLVAEYNGLNTSVANFIAEYLVNASPDLKNEASNSTEVDLTMHLRGELMSPVINFDIGFPNLRGTLQSYTDSKLRLLKQDQNELNKQVLGLIIAGQFIPSDINTFSGSEIIYNTVSEFVSNQLSLLLTELFSEFIDEGAVLSGIDFDIAYTQYQNVDLGEGQGVNRGDELEVRLRQNFFNDRLSILVGGNIALSTNVPTVPGANTGAFVGNDLVIEYVLNKDRSLKLRVYQLLEPDIGGGRRLEIGTGLSYRKEFESFGEFLKSIRRSVLGGKPKQESPPADPAPSESLVTPGMR